ncbi:cytochrome c [Rhodopseudomonas sp.]|uniref:c-type cytochrome n=1 Tax=Rhodopseudomonas sp. TaxID=1078 RepID=UPI00345604C8
MVLLLVRLHRASGVIVPETSRGQQLAAAWCQECHAIDATATPSSKIGAPEFRKIANLPSTTELALKVFLRSNHTNMPNVVIQPSDADEIVQYILGLRRN